MRRLLLILVLLLSATATADESTLLLLYSTRNPNSATGNCSNIATLHPEDVLCVPENITGTPN